MSETSTTEVVPTDRNILQEGATAAPKIQPLWNARHTDEGAVLEVALPGVSKDQLKLEIGNRSLRLEATRRRGPENARLIRGGEWPAGYELELRLDDSLEGTHATAKLEDGILTVTLPLAEAAKPRRIEVA